MHTLFLDANIFFAATCSDKGASRWIFELAKNNKLKIVSNNYALQEAKKNVALKLHETKMPIFYSLISYLNKVDQKTGHNSGHYSHLTNPKDLPILLSALKLKVNFLITLDKKAFHPEVIKTAELPLKIMSPGEYLRQSMQGL